MERYADKSGSSGVLAYETGADYIKVRFKANTAVYKYTYRLPGRRHVEKMKALAKSGKGLSTYISQFIRTGYESVL